MNICFPVAQNDGLASLVFNHFGSAPLFLLIDSETRQIQELAKHQQGHGQGCSQHLTLSAAKVDALILSGIGRGALAKLAASGIKVYQAQGATIADNILCLVDGRLTQMTTEGSCAGHSHAHEAQHSCHH